jgi:hypothetical protein
MSPVSPNLDSIIYIFIYFFIYSVDIRQIMSSKVDVDTDAGAKGYGIIAGAGALILGGMYYAGFNFSSWANIVLAITAVLVALLIWFLLTDVEKFAKLVVENQMVAVAGSLLIGAGVLVSVMQNVGMKTLLK